MGSPKIAQILYFEDEADTADGKGGKTSADAELAIPARERKSRRRNHKEPPTPTTPSRHNTPTRASNISLNFCKAKNLGELWLFAILGIILQFSSLIFIGVSRYHPKINPKEDENSKYAYPLMASGTPILVIGMMACLHVVKASSEENTWVADSDFKILWLQKSARVNDQLFDSYALFGDGRRKKHITTRRRPCTSPSGSSRRTKYEVYLTCSLGNLAIVGSFISIAGFVTQFVGIRSLH
ncbi:unnamed protein product [Tuber aestivum]|uniref:Uncharacterized protein n=1 Tax=Tuber aestivum TaxID=59557 RepID=A0A292Q3E1_9PEZI|nr:unnamed protein product [Tuber aestivum]